ncbi:hypothetical protein [Hymenobacter sp. HDW8]|nr:hypothetical protein [Hymenobacter sp. HDW8]QIL78365.1 hypothetical protein G7064_21355 [Hymenobacter sp. HDW8]
MQRIRDPGRAGELGIHFGRGRKIVLLGPPVIARQPGPDLRQGMAELMRR